MKACHYLLVAFAAYSATLSGPSTTRSGKLIHSHCVPFLPSGFLSAGSSLLCYCGVDDRRSSTSVEYNNMGTIRRGQVGMMVMRLLEGWRGAKSGESKEVERMERGAT